jgi:broad specificity phosphatase PhoE
VSTKPSTKVFLVRHGNTDWHEQGKLMGRRDRPLSPDGEAQSRSAAEALSTVAIAEIIASPLLRAVQTAQVLGERVGIDIARDNRLTDLDLGHWEGMPLAEIAATSAYQEFINNPLATDIPGGENLDRAKRRALAAIEQALEDNATGDAIAVVTHASIIRVLLTHYMGAQPAVYHRVRVSPGSISVLSFSHEGPPRVLAFNWRQGLAEVL